MKNPERLHSHPCFEHFDALGLHQLAECSTVHAGVAGERLFEEGDRSADFFLLEEGEVRQSRVTAFGEFTLSEQTTGEIFGASSFVDETPRDSHAVALAPSRMVAFKADALRTACEKDKKFELSLYWALWKILSKQLRGANARLGLFFSADIHLPNAMTPAAAPLGVFRHLRPLHQSRPVSRAEALADGNQLSRLTFARGTFRSWANDLSRRGTGNEDVCRC